MPKLAYISLVLPQPLKFLMELYPFIESRLGGHLSYKNMILTSFTNLVRLIKMPMG
jgi:hypothetical protein